MATMAWPECVHDEPLHLPSQRWAEQRNLPAWQGDVMHQLRQIQGETTFPLSVREAAQRLLTKVTEQAQSPMTMQIPSPTQAPHS